MNPADEQYKTLKEEFMRIAKNIYIYKTENRTLPSQTKINKDVNNLFDAYDNLVTLIVSIFETQSTEAKEFLRKDVEHYFKPKLIQTLVAYNLTVDLPTDFDIINRGAVTKCTLEQSQELANESGASTSLVTENLADSTPIIEPIEEQTEQQQNAQNNNQCNTQSHTMVQTIAEFLAQTGPFLKHKFDGEPSKLEGFLNDVDMIIGMVEANNAPVKAFCVKFIKSKLEGRASECMPDEVNTVEDITNALKRNIKAESSKVIEGKVTALRVKNGDLTKYSEEAEKLTEALRRSYISEGLTKEKARQMTIEKTIDMCRRSARNDIVKSVLSSTSYDTPSEVIAKYITQVDLVKRENLERQNSKNFKPNKTFHKNNFQGQNDRRQNFNRDQNAYRNSYGNRQKQQYHRGNRHTNDNARGKFNKNEHTIRFVTQPQPGTSRDSEQNPNGSHDESFFRIGNP